MEMRVIGFDIINAYLASSFRPLAIAINNWLVLVIGATISVISATAFSKNANIVVYFLVLSFTITKIRRIFIPNDTVFKQTLLIFWRQ